VTENQSNGLKEDPPLSKTICNGNVVHFNMPATFLNGQKDEFFQVYLELA
jgi:hypothetical protein